MRASGARRGVCCSASRPVSARAFESIGYGLTALLLSGGDNVHIEQMLFVRTVLAPAGRGASTGVVCATLWRARERSASASVPLAFVAVVLLHGWVIAAVSFTLLLLAGASGRRGGSGIQHAQASGRSRGPGQLAAERNHLDGCSGLRGPIGGGARSVGVAP
ncbi:MAG: hypothetical protein ACXVHX_32615 [Solirubrobacteraceae bacterium]